MADPLSLEELQKDVLIQPSLRFPSTDAMSVLAARVSALDLSPEIIYTIPTVEKTALPFLMDQFDVLLYENWAPEKSDELRRNLILRSIELHRSKGTLAGIKKHVALTGAEVIRADTADNKFFAGEEITAENFKIWKDTFPEVRIYDFIDTVEDIASGMPGPAFGFEDSFLGSSDGVTFFCGGWDAPVRTGRKAVLIKDGVLTDLIWGALQEDMLYEQLRVPGDAEGAFFPDLSLFQEFLGDPVPSERVLSYRVTPEDTYAGYQHNLLKPGLTPLNIVPERVFEGTIDDLGIYTEEAWEPFWLMESTVHLRVYDSVRLADKEHRAKIPYSTAYLDSVRFPVDSFTAEVLTKVEGVKPPSAFEFVDDFLVEDQLSVLNNALDAMEVSQSFRDTLFAKTRLHKPVQFGDKKRFGQFRFGDWTEI